MSDIGVVLSDSRTLVSVSDQNDGEVHLKPALVVSIKAGLYHTHQRQLCPGLNIYPTLTIINFQAIPFSSILSMNPEQSSKLNPLAPPFVPSRAPPFVPFPHTFNVSSVFLNPKRDIKVRRYHLPGLPKRRSHDLLEQEVQRQGHHIVELERRVGFLQEKLRGIEEGLARSEEIADCSSDVSYEGPNVFLMFGL